MRPPLKTLLLFSVVALTCLVGSGRDAIAQTTVAKPYVTLFTSANPDASEMDLISWFQGGFDHRLTQLRAGSNWNHYTDQSPLYQQRFARYFSPYEFPVLCVQKPDGAVIYKCSARTLPGSASEMADEIDYYSTLKPYGVKGFMMADSAVHYGRLTRADQLQLTSTTGQCVDGQCFPNLRPPQQQPPSQLWDSKDLLDFQFGPLVQLKNNSELVIVFVVFVAGLMIYKRMKSDEDEDD